MDWPRSIYLEGKEVEQLDGVVHTDGLSFVVEAKDPRISSCGLPALRRDCPEAYDRPCEARLDGDATAADRARSGPAKQ